MDPVVYASLPPSKKKEYMEMFPEPTAKPIIISEDNNYHSYNGYALYYRTRFYRDCQKKDET